MVGRQGDREATGHSDEAIHRHSMQPLCLSAEGRGAADTTQYSAQGRQITPFAENMYLMLRRPRGDDRPNTLLAVPTLESLGALSALLQWSLSLSHSSLFFSHKSTVFSIHISFPFLLFLNESRMQSSFTGKINYIRN